MEVRAIVLAAGKGTRMNSDLPKCAHHIIDKSMVEYVVDNLYNANVKKIVTIVGYGREVLEKILAKKSDFAYQEDQLGTAHAVLMAEEQMKDFKGITIIAIGDMPRISSNTYKNIIDKHLKSGSDLTVLTTDHPNPFGYGRIKRDKTGYILGIIEERDCSDEEKLITEINSSIYVVDNKKLFSSLKEIGNDNNQKEYYLTDIIKVFNKKSYKVSSYKALDYLELSGVNDKFQLMTMEEDLQRKIIKRHLVNGVTIHNPSTVTIGEGVEIKAGANILSSSIIVGHSVIEKNAIIGPFASISNSLIGNSAIVKYSSVEDSIIKDDESIGPYKTIKNKE